MRAQFTKGGGDEPGLAKSNTERLLAEFTEVRNKTMELFKPLKVEDAVIQSDTFGSPPNWHIAHVSWFFHKVLERYGANLMTDENDDRHTNIELRLDYLNSYYQKYGSILPKSLRGKFPRPTVQETIKYREFIEQKVTEFLRDGAKKNIDSGISEDLEYDITLGNHHEMQHQELMVYDFQHYFQRFEDPFDNYNPLRIADTSFNNHDDSSLLEKPSGMVSINGGMFKLGFNDQGFCYDNELPEHSIYLHPFKIDVAPVTNGQYMKFIESGGYEDYKYWFADGWDLVKEHGWKAPLYWEKREKDGIWIKKDFRSVHPINQDEPVVNVSYYEADAYARWDGKRLPTEAEWEKAASWNEELDAKTLYPWGNELPLPERANLLESYNWGPSIIGSYPKGKSYYGCHQMVGDVWEWTCSEYVLYPGFQSLFPEYTDKWAVNQKVLRGGSFATPKLQIRNSYRNYFKPHERILFAGFRCAADC